MPSPSPSAEGPGLDLLPHRATRRQLLALMALGVSGAPLVGRPRSAVWAVAFDAFVLFNALEVARRAREIAGDKDDALISSASAKLFGYTWHYTSAGRYVGFEALARDAFKAAAQTVGVRLTNEGCAYLVHGYSSLGLWPDVQAALAAFRAQGLKLAMLSNFSKPMLIANLRSNGVERYFEAVLSTDEVRQFKPAPRAYALGVQALRAPKEKILFAASAGWDASGATWFGYPTVWVNRTGALAEEAFARPALVASSIDGVLELAGAQPRA